MKQVIGMVLIVAGIALGAYMGIWWAFIGGIVDVIQAIRAEHLEAMDVAIGVAKVIFAGLIGWISCALLVFPGLALAK